MKLAWGALLNAEERGRVVDIALGVGCDPSHLSACIYFESRWDPAAVNAVSGATGLIQFMPKTAIGLGTTVEDLRRMNRAEQLNFVAAYFAPYKGRLRTLSDVYMAILWPAAVGKPEDYVIFANGTTAYTQNSALDVDRDKAVTKAEAAAFVQRRLEEGLRDGNAADTETQAPAPIEEAGTQYQGPFSEGADMTGLADFFISAAPVAGTALGGPLGGVIGGLVAGIIKSMQPLAAEKIAGALTKHTSPEIAQSVSNALTNTIVDAAQKLTGKADPVEALVLAKNDPEMVTTLQGAALAKLDELLPVFDKLAARDDATNAAALSGKDAAAARGQRDRVDLAPLLARMAGSLVGCATLILLGALVYALFTDPDGKVAIALVGLAGPLLARVYGNFSQIFDYRFDGTPASQASQAISAELAARRPTQGASR